MRILPSNALRDKAVHACLQLASSTSKTQPGTKSKTRNSSIFNNDKDAYSLPKTSLKYQVSLSHSAFSGPTDILLKYVSDTSKEKKLVFEQENSFTTDIPIKFNPSVRFILIINTNYIA